MRFTYLGATYEIEFQRNRKKKNTIDLGIAPSRMTTVKIYRSEPGKVPGELFREASSTCSVLDPFVAAKGRIGALKAVSRTLDKGFKAALWEAYEKRFPVEAPKPTNVIPFPVQA